MPGLPGKADVNTYGGILANYLGQGVVDPTTDLDAAAHNQAMADLAGLTRTGIRAWALINAQAGPTVASHDAVWGNGGGVAPTVSRTGAGIWVVTWPSTITDALGVVQTVTHSASGASINGNGSYTCGTVDTAANVVTAYTFTPSTGAAADLGAGIKLLVWLL